MIRQSHNSGSYTAFYKSVISKSALLGSLISFSAIGSQSPTTNLTVSAAETDWQVAQTASLCRGQYVERSSTANQKTGSDLKIDASAKSALHVESHSTTLTGQVSLNYDKQQLNGDFATMDAATEIVSIEGNVTLRQEGLLIKGDRMTGNLYSGAAAIDSATFLLHQSRIRGSATRLSKDSRNTLTISDGNFTTCEPDSNVWSISGSDIDLIKSKGHGIAKDVTLRIKDVPVAYIPYFRFPIDDSRQSGFLWPALGSDSDGGTDVAIPYYFNIAPNLDATYTLRSVWKRGVMHEGEIRYLNSYSQNLLAGTFLGSDDEYDSRDQFNTAIPAGPEKEDRWLSHFSHKGRNGPWSSTVNYTSVSDIDYLDDLGGFTNTQSDFDTALDTGNSPALVRSGALSYTTTSWRSSLELRSFQELGQTRSNQYETLPRFTLAGSTSFGRVSSSALLQVTAFDSSSNIEPEGRRIVADLESSIPLRNSWGYITPGARYVHRSYNLDNQAIGLRDNASINTGIASLDMGLVFERNTTAWRKDYHQTLEPRLYYLYAEEEYQADLPSFDSLLITPGFNSLFRQNRYAGYDRIGDANQIALGVTTRYLDAATGNEVLTISAGQIFHLEDREVISGDFIGNDPSSDTSPLFISLESKGTHFGVRASYEHDTERNHSNRGSLALRYISNKGAVFNFGYSMVAQDQQRTPRNEEETDLSFQIPLGKSQAWSLVGRWNYGWDNGQTIESLFGVEYNDCCWKTRIVFRRNLEEPRVLAISNPGSATQFIQDRRADSGIYFEFQLKGLASLGGRLDNLLHNSIPGFDPGR